MRSCLGVSSDSNVPVDFFKLLSTEITACSKPQNEDNHSKVHYPKTQKRDQGEDWTQIMRPGLL